MNKYLKWALWILGALLFAAVFFAIGYFAYTQWNGGGWMMGERGENIWRGDERLPWRNMPMHPGLTRPGSRIFGFSMLGFIFGGLVRLGILALIIAGIVALVRSLQHRPVTAAATAAPVVPVVQPVPEPVEPGKTCSSCGRAVQADWAHCPYCGNTLT